MVAERALWGLVAVGVLAATEISAPFADGTSWMSLVFIGRISTVLAHVMSGRAQEHEMESKVEHLPLTARRPFSVLPYIAIAALYGLLVVALGRGNHLDAATWGVLVAAVCSTGVVVARQLSAFSDNAQLLRTLDESFRREQESNRARQQLEIELRHAQKLEALGKLSGGVAHELNTPLQYLRNNVSFLDQSFATLVDALRAHRRGETVEPADLDFLIDEVPSSLTDTLVGLDRMAEIVSSLRGFGDDETNHTGIIDVNQVLADTLMVVRSDIDRVAQLDLDAGTIPLVAGDARALGQVFLHLLNNAVHAVEASGRAPGSIRLRTWAQDEKVMIQIVDDGCGMASDVAERAFDPFFTTKAVGVGTGQGLTIARSVVVDHCHGEIDFSTEAGQGTSFTVRLPARATADISTNSL